MPQCVTVGQGEVWSLTVFTPAAITLVDMTVTRRKGQGRGGNRGYVSLSSLVGRSVLGNDAILLVLNLKSQLKAEWPSIYQNFAKRS